MDPHESASSRSLWAAVRGAEAVATLPAVPTPDWCDRAARSLLSHDRTSVVLLAFARLNPDGSVSKIESVGAAAAMVAEVATNVGRRHADSSPVGLDAAHPTLAHLRTSATSHRPFGWSPSSLLQGHSSAAPAARTLNAAANGGETPVLERWKGGAIGPVEVVLAAAWFGPPQHNRAIMVELGLSPGPGVPNLDEAAAVLDALMPALTGRAALAFDPAQPLENQHLTVREETVLRRLLEGKSVRQIAEELGRSPHTVHDHVKSLHRKLDASTRGALVARALGHIKPGQSLEPEPKPAPTAAARPA